MLPTQTMQYQKGLKINIDLHVLIPPQMGN